MFQYDVIIIGAGHAGCEAAMASARLGAKTLLITLDLNKIAQMSCNPAVGGIAKGQIVREIDALGGHMGLITDRTAIQFRLLNRSKGPAMWSPRAQCDRQKFILEWRSVLEKEENLRMWQDEASEILVEGGRVVGVRTAWGAEFRAGAVVVCAGTFLRGLMHVGRTQIPGGRVAEPAATLLTQNIAAQGIEYFRMKTGTPVRIDARTVDFSQTTVQEGEETYHRFSFLSSPRPLPQLPCWTLETNEQVHRALEKGLADSPLFNGQIQSIGPRYCPSIETKITTFPERTSHPLFLEPEGTDTTELYLNGFSSSLPLHVQLEALRHIPALRNAHIFRPGYAIEYDFFPPTQLHPTLESKRVQGLYFAGQVNGTTGYEEAAGQGLLAGINAARKVGGQEGVVLHRDEAYIGVLIDDLVTKGVDEPYRMFTSRAEYRILLRQDAADARLTPISSQIGLATAERRALWKEKSECIDFIEHFCCARSVKPGEINTLLATLDLPALERGAKASELVCRPQLTLGDLLAALPDFREETDHFFDAHPTLAPFREEVLDAAEIKLKYAGYIERERQQAEKVQRLEGIRLADDFDFNAITQLSTEARQKLTSIRPRTLAQASRIPGVSPSDISVLLVILGR